MKFFLNVFILILLIGLSDQVIGRILRHYYFKQLSGLYYRTTFAIDSTTADILIFGSSRANHHYVPEIFEDSLNLSFYNLGREGNFLLYNYAVFKSLVKRYTPKIVLFDVNIDELNYEKASYDRLSSLLPYYRDHPEIRNVIELKSPYEKLKLVSEIYPFNSSLITIVIGNTEINKTRKKDREGYVPLMGYLGDTIKSKIEIRSELPDTNKVNAILEIIQYCNMHKIQLIFIQSPIFAKVKKTKSTDLAEHLFKQNKVPFWDYLNDPFFLHNPDYFQDKDHLNDLGATCFSKLIVKRLEEYLTVKSVINVDLNYN